MKMNTRRRREKRWETPISCGVSRRNHNGACSSWRGSVCLLASRLPLLTLSTVQQPAIPHLFVEGSPSLLPPSKTPKIRWKLTVPWRLATELCTAIQDHLSLAEGVKDLSRSVLIASVFWTSSGVDGVLLIGSTPGTQRTPNTGQIVSKVSCNQVKALQ